MQSSHALDPEVRFQPIVSACTGTAAGAEALLRGRIGGASFPPRALVRQLHLHGTSVTDLVVAQVARAFDHWSARGEDTLWCSVNLDAWDLERGRPDLVIRQRVGEHRAHRIVAEITVLHPIDLERGARTVERLRALGVRIAIDDFGIGDAGGRMFDLIDPDIVKIDGRFVAGLDQPGGARAMVQATAALGRRAGLEVIADGVTSTTQLACLRSLGVDLMQGPVVGEPATPEHLVLRGRCRRLVG